MDSYFTEKAPAWTLETSKKRDLVVGDDIDSLASCCLLEKITACKWSINKFYDFMSVYKAANEKSYRSIGVDMSLVLKGFYCFDNHVNRLMSGLDFSNPAMFNVNLFYKQNERYIARDQYELKYSLSTLLEIWSYYNLPLPESEEGKALLLAIDTSFKGYYIDRFHNTYKFWMLNCLRFPQLLRILKQHDAAYFYNLIKKYHLSNKIRINENGQLQTNIDLKSVSHLLGFDIKLTDKRFIKVKEFKQVSGKVFDTHLPDKWKKNVFSFAFTGKNYNVWTQKTEAKSKQIF